MSPAAVPPFPGPTKPARNPWRSWKCSGVFESWRIDSATVRARSEAEAKRVFRNRYKSPRSVTTVTAYPVP